MQCLVVWPTCAVTIKAFGEHVAQCSFAAVDSEFGDKVMVRTECFWVPASEGVDCRQVRVFVVMARHQAVEMLPVWGPVTNMTRMLHGDTEHRTGDLIRPQACALAL